MKDPVRKRLIITKLKCLLGFHYWYVLSDKNDGIIAFYKCRNCGKIKISLT